jgi:hypothetical protein
MSNVNDNCRFCMEAIESSEIIPIDQVLEADFQTFTQMEVCFLFQQNLLNKFTIFDFS